MLTPLSQPPRLTMDQPVDLIPELRWLLTQHTCDTEKTPKPNIESVVRGHRNPRIRPAPVPTPIVERSHSAPKSAR